MACFWPLQPVYNLSYEVKVKDTITGLQLWHFLIDLIDPEIFFFPNLQPLSCHSLIQKHDVASNFFSDWQMWVVYHSVQGHADSGSNRNFSLGCHQPSLKTLFSRQFLLVAIFQTSPIFTFLALPLLIIFFLHLIYFIVS